MLRSVNCPECNSEQTGTSKFCSECGIALDPNVAGTLTFDQGPNEEDAQSATPNSSIYGRFLPGARLAKRYRIVALLGRGGMGEVYRADDLKLRQAVALKFLPRHLAQDPERLDWFHREARLARQISHPNVCRVYDIGEFEGEHFLSMEFIDGEDLGRLLRRIGRLPPAKSIQIARQLCVGLAAAHERGVLHRDLKPANVMIDGAGQARITDFGLAVTPSSEIDAPTLAGTPRYMAPEQFLRGETSVRSDIYALGLVIYELSTGQNAYPTARLAELKKIHEQASLPRPPSSLIDDMDPELDRLVMRCLQKEPKDRPQSAAELLEALPGKESWAAAFAAGETPSPEAIANAKKEGMLSPRLAVPLLFIVLAGLCSIAFMNDRFQLIRQVPPPKEPAVLVDRARQLVSTLGYPEPPADRAFGYADSWETLDTLVKNQLPLPHRSIGAQPAALYFWYREADENLVSLRQSVQNPPGRVTLHDPPPLRPGMANVVVDPHGRLLAFLRIPETNRGDVKRDVDWQKCWEAAGLDSQNMLEAEPRLAVPVPADQRIAWVTTFPGEPSVRVEVEAAAHHGNIVFFQIIAPWTDPAMLYLDAESLPKTAAESLYVLAFLLVGTLCVVFARHNIRMDRADTRTAFRLAIYLGALQLACWLLAADLTLSPKELLIALMNFVGYAAFWSVVPAICYLAIEPYIRRWWPSRFISWNRVWRGRLSDPIVGRDLLVGAALGTVWTCVDQFNHQVPQWVADRPRVPVTLGSNVEFLTSPLLPLLQCQASAVEEALIGFGLLFLLMLVIRSQKLALAIVCSIAITKLALADPQLAVMKALPGMLMVALVMWSALRLGPFVLAVALFFYQVTIFTPITYDARAWYSVNGWIVSVTLLAIATWGLFVCIRRDSVTDWLTEPFGVRDRVV